MGIILAERKKDEKFFFFFGVSIGLPENFPWWWNRQREKQNNHVIYNIRLQSRVDSFFFFFCFDRDDYKCHFRSLSKTQFVKRSTLLNDLSKRMDRLARPKGLEISKTTSSNTSGASLPTSSFTPSVTISKNQGNPPPQSKSRSTHD